MKHTDSSHMRQIEKPYLYISYTDIECVRFNRLAITRSTRSLVFEYTNSVHVCAHNNNKKKCFYRILPPFFVGVYSFIRLWFRACRWNENMHVFGCLCEWISVRIGEIYRLPKSVSNFKRKCKYIGLISRVLGVCSWQLRRWRLLLSVQQWNRRNKMVPRRLCWMKRCKVLSQTIAVLTYSKSFGIDDEEQF